MESDKRKVRCKNISCEENVEGNCISYTVQIDESGICEKQAMPPITVRIGLDISNDKPRKIACRSKNDEGMMASSENHYMLEIGKIYNLQLLEVHSWYTLVYLEEFPGISFNSVVFNDLAIG